MLSIIAFISSTALFNKRGARGKLATVIRFAFLLCLPLFSLPNFSSRSLTRNWGSLCTLIVIYIPHCSRDAGMNAGKQQILSEGTARHAARYRMKTKNLFTIRPIAMLKPDCDNRSAVTQPTFSRAEREKTFPRSAFPLLAQHPTRGKQRISSPTSW